MVLFSKFGKTVNDLFKEDKYELNQTVSVKGTSGSTEWTAEAGFPINEGQSSAKLVFIQEDQKFGKVEVNIENIKASKIDYETPNLMDGLKVNLVAQKNKPREKLGFDLGANLSLKAEYAQGQLAGKITAEVGGKENKLTAEGAYEVKGVWLGAEVVLTTQGVDKKSLGIHYPIGDTRFDVKTDTKTYNVMLHKELSPMAEVAADYEFDPNQDKTKFSLGGKWALDEKSTTQGFITSGWNAYLLYTHKLSDRLTASLGTSFDFNNLHQDNANVHCKIEMEA